MTARLALFVGGPYGGEVRTVELPGPVLFQADYPPPVRPWGSEPWGSELVEETQAYEMLRFAVGDGVIDVYAAPDVTRSQLLAAFFDAVVAERIRPAFRRAPADFADSPAVGG